MKRYTILLLTLLSVLMSKAQTAFPKHEVRAVWLTTIGGLDWPRTYAQSAASVERQKAELCQTLDRLRQANINTVLLQTRVRATTIYPSALEPWDGCLSGRPGTSPGYDALQFAIDECHRRGMELHAWVVTIPVGKWNALGCTRLRQKYPKLIIKIGDEGYMNPEAGQTGDYLANVCHEIASRYDVDGIHLDYIRYPETWNKKTNRANGRAHITSIVRKIHHTVKQEKPWVKISCSPIGKYDDLTRYWSRGWNANTTVCQDAQGWLREGLMDALFPMMYFQGNNFFPFAIDWAECSYGRIIAPGLAAYMLHPSEQNWPLDVMKRELNVLRQYGMGHTFFRSRFFTDNTKGLYDYVEQQFDRYPALLPPMTWEHAQAPKSPTNLVRHAESLSWTPLTDRSATLLYNVYASRQYPVDTEDARNLVAHHLRTTSVRIARDDDAPRYYAVTAMDRYGNESRALQMKPEIRAVAPARLLKNDGIRLQLPNLKTMLDVRYVAIESMAGNLIVTKPVRGTFVDIRDIKDGVYTVRTINAKNVTHRLGYFIIKRL